MHFFIHHQCDLEMMEQRMSSNRYKSLAELRGDAATIVHNVMLCFDGLFLLTLFRDCIPTSGCFRFSDS